MQICWQKMDREDNRKKEIVDVFEEVAAIFAASGVEITPAMLDKMQPVLEGSQSFEAHRASLVAEMQEA